MSLILRPWFLGFQEFYFKCFLLGEALCNSGGSSTFFTKSDTATKIVQIHFHLLCMLFLNNIVALLIDYNAFFEASLCKGNVSIHFGGMERPRKMASNQSSWKYLTIYVVLKIYFMVGLPQSRPPQPWSAWLQHIHDCTYLGVSGLGEMWFITFKQQQKKPKKHQEVNNRNHNRQSKQLLVREKICGT